MSDTTAGKPQVGDAVAVVGITSIRISKVDRITPSGRLVIGSDQFRYNRGRFEKMGGSWETAEFPVTDDHRRTLHRAKRAREVRETVQGLMGIAGVFFTDENLEALKDIYQAAEERACNKSRPD